jgi:glutathione S-transferase
MTNSSEHAPVKNEYAIDRFAMEVKRQLDVLDRRLAENQYIVGDSYTRALNATSKSLLIRATVRSAWWPRNVRRKLSSMALIDTPL